MIKLIFYNNDFKQIKNICNNVINSFENLQIVGIATKEQELCSLIKKTNADLIIYKYEDVNNSNILKVIDNYKIKIIFYNYLKGLDKNPNTLYIKNNTNYALIKKQLANFIYKNNELIIYQKVFKILKKLNFNFKLKGTFFLINCITFSILNKDKYVSDNLEKNVYPQIAKQFSVTITTVKWSIIRAINDVNTYSNNPKYPNEKVTPKVLINEIINKIN